MRFNADEDAPIVAKNYAPRNAQPIPAGLIDSEPSLNIKVNQVWFSHLIGVIAALDQPDAWQGTQAQIEDARAEIRKLIASTEQETLIMSLPVGFVIPSASLVAAVPDWLLLCDGAIYNRLDYPDLYDVLETAFVLDANTFKVPDLNAKFPLGTVSADVGSEGGASTHTLLQSEMPSHNHKFTPTAGNTWMLDVTGPPPPVAFPDVGWGSSPGSGTWAYTIPSTQSAGSNAAHNNMPPFQRLRYFIVARDG